MKPTAMIATIATIATIAAIGLSISLCAGAEPRPVNCDEAKVPQYTLPDPLVLANGQKVTDAQTWTSKRRPELLEQFRQHIYGRAPVGRPEDLAFAVTDRAPHRKQAAITFSGPGGEPGPQPAVGR